MQTQTQTRKEILMYSPSRRTSFTFSIQQPVKCEKVCTSALYRKDKDESLTNIQPKGGTLVFCATFALYHKDKEESSVNEDPTNSNKLLPKKGGML